MFHAVVTLDSKESLDSRDSRACAPKKQRPHGLRGTSQGRPEVLSALWRPGNVTQYYKLNVLVAASKD